MRARSRTSVTVGALAVATIAASFSCGSPPAVGFAPEADAGSRVDAGSAAYPGFGSGTPAAWSMSLGGTAVTPYAVSAAVDGTVRVAGTLRGSATIGRASLNSAGGSDVLLVKLDSAGREVWAHNYGDAEDQSASASVVDDEGNVIVAGTFAGTLDLMQDQPVLLSAVVGTSTPRAPGVAPLHARGSADAFVAKLDASGVLIWSTQLGGRSATTQAQGVALRPDGGIAVTGSFEGTVGFGDQVATSAGGTDAFVVALDSSGTTQWARTFGQSGMDRGTALAVNGRAEVLITGNYEGGIDLGTGQLQGYGMEDVFVGKLSATGNTLWAKGFGGPIGDDAVSVAFDPAGSALTLGNYAGPVDLGTGPLPSHSQAGAQYGWDIYAAKYDGLGLPQWASRYGSADSFDKGDALAVDALGNAYIAGHVRSAFTFGQCPVSPMNAEFGDAFVGIVDPEGVAICATEYGYGATTHIRSLALPPFNGVVMVGDFVGGVTFGPGQQSLNASTDTGFVARSQPISRPLQ